MNVLQWSITAILLFFVGLYAGRFWEKQDRRVKKDRALIEKILTLIPVDGEAINFLRYHDFGSPYSKGTLTALWELKRLLIQPNGCFLNKKLEMIRKDLQREIDGFDKLMNLEVFVNDKREAYSGADKSPGQIRYEGQRRRTLGETILDEEVEVIENHYREIEELNRHSTNIYYMYGSLISMAHEEL